MAYLKSEIDPTCAEYGASDRWGDGDGNLDGTGDGYGIGDSAGSTKAYVLYSSGDACAAMHGYGGGGCSENGATDGCGCAGGN